MYKGAHQTRHLNEDLCPSGRRGHYERGPKGGSDMRHDARLKWDPCAAGGKYCSAAGLICCI